MRALVTLTVAEGKQLIAESIAIMPQVQRAVMQGKILFKGGTTVSAVLERLTGQCLRISGRISPRGTKGSGTVSRTAHSVLLEQGRVQNIDTCFAETVQSLACEDVAVLGANALDVSGRAAMLFGSPLGGNPGEGMAGLWAQGCQVMIACGLEKLIPTSIDVAIQAAGIQSFDWAMGMAVGLTPLVGTVITEQRALEQLADVRCVVIAAGGISGAEGAQTLAIEGEPIEVEKTVKFILSIKGARTKGVAETMKECVCGSPGCSIHRSCAWRKAQGGDLKW
ncbi:hypothetical protein Ga0466249_000603 [Sporomusaceae bacterium BoRhaA]|uniref:hypothetical protein n=1 Tax=Pelorhabdus rhamnosifermentans TaxID=2772457 RepID=UPI001C0645F9|nr:hypothetical protein [Pelorhabdus rhamnosifermentans]MBU2699524.1 hypothetical protein [Pelorhabdus rhamnosifermentans]